MKLNENIKRIHEVMGIGQTTPQTKPSTDVVIFMGGRDEPPKYKPLSEQVDLLKTGLRGKTVIAYRYTELSKVLQSIKQNPTATVILFSKGCAVANSVAKSMTNVNKLFILEPYALDPTTVSNVRDAVNTYKVPKKNVCVGNNSGRGHGIVDGTTEMPTLKGGVMESHWNALKIIGNLI